MQSFGLADLRAPGPSILRTFGQTGRPRIFQQGANAREQSDRVWEAANEGSGNV